MIVSSKALLLRSYIHTTLLDIVTNMYMKAGSLDMCVCVRLCFLPLISACHSLPTIWYSLCHSGRQWRSWTVFLGRQTCGADPDSSLQRVLFRQRVAEAGTCACCWRLSVRAKEVYDMIFSTVTILEVSHEPMPLWLFDKDDVQISNPLNNYAFLQRGSLHPSIASNFITPKKNFFGDFQPLRHLIITWY